LENRTATHPTLTREDVEAIVKNGGKKLKREILEEAQTYAKRLYNNMKKEVLEIQRALSKALEGMQNITSKLLTAPPNQLNKSGHTTQCPTSLESLRIEGEAQATEQCNSEDSSGEEPCRIDSLPTKESRGLGAAHRSHNRGHKRYIQGRNSQGLSIEKAHTQSPNTLRADTQGTHVQLRGARPKA
jgi:hypothetical protein